MFSSCFRQPDDQARTKADQREDISRIDALDCSSFFTTYSVIVRQVNCVTVPFFSFHTLNHLTAEMYPIDRVKMARHIYEMVSSLRKTGLLLQVSHMTIARWVKNPVRKQYDSHRRTRKRNVVSEFIRAAVINDPFLSNFKLRTIVRETFGFNVSKELVRTVIRRHGFTKKNARFHGYPYGLEDKTLQFIQNRDMFLRAGKKFVSIDETSFGRRGVCQQGYAPVGVPLYIRCRKKPRMTTYSSLVVVSDDGKLKSCTRKT